MSRTPRLRQTKHCECKLDCSTTSAVCTDWEPKKHSATRSHSRRGLRSNKPPPIQTSTTWRSLSSTWVRFSLTRSGYPRQGRSSRSRLLTLRILSRGTPTAIDFQSNFGVVLSVNGKWLDQTGKTAEGKLALETAVEHRRSAVKLSKNSPACRELLGSHLADLADVNLKLGAYEQSAHVALDIPKAVSSTGRADGCFTAARILARLVMKVSGDVKLTQAERDRLTQSYLGRTAVLLREAIDTDPKLAELIKIDADIKALQVRSEFKTIMNTLVNIGQ